MLVESFQCAFAADGIPEEHDHKVHHVVVAEATAGKAHTLTDLGQDILLTKVLSQQGNFAKPGRWTGRRLRCRLDDHRFISDTIHVDLLDENGFILPLQGDIFSSGWQPPTISLRKSWDWERLVEQVGAAVPKDWKVIVLADRGLYAAWLFEVIKQQGWHPFLRVNATMGFRQEGQEDFRLIGSLLTRSGRSWRGEGTCSEQGEQVQARLLIRWEKGYEEAVAVITDLAEEQAEVGWYFLRFWIEGEYKDHKSGGLGWQQTKMTDAKRAERLWLAMAVTMQMAVLVGGLEEAREQELAERAKRLAKACRRVGRPAKALWKPRGREQSVFMRGLQSLKVAVIRGKEWPEGYVVSEAWPQETYRRNKPTKGWLKKRKQKEADREKKQRRHQPESGQQMATGHLSGQQHQQRQPHARRATTPQAIAQRQRQREAKRQQAELEQAARQMQRQRQHQQRLQEPIRKRQERMRAREEREQIREQRRHWHEENQRDREARQLRRAQRAVQASKCSPGASSTPSKILPLAHMLDGPLEPP